MEIGKYLYKKKANVKAKDSAKSRMSFASNVAVKAT